jgi:hypothetical protein
MYFINYINHKRILSLACVSLLLLSACQQEELSKETPYSYDISTQRSIHIAEALKDRLDKEGVQSQVVPMNKGDAIWYHVVTTPRKTLELARQDSIQVSKLFPKLETSAILFQKVVASMDSARGKEIGEIERVEHLVAKISPSADSVVRFTPYLPDFELIRMNLFSTYANSSGNRSVYGTSDITIDFPRGVVKDRVAAVSSAFSEAVLLDPLLRELMTLHTIKLASPAPLTDSLVSEWADRILATGAYQDEQKTDFLASGNKSWKGYIVRFKDGDKVRSYVLASDGKEWVMFLQSSSDRIEEFKAIIADAGRDSDGADGYSEFHNSFATLPSNTAEGDEFLGMTFQKLGASYAREKGYANWAKAYVGHLSMKAYYRNPRKGIWTYGIFDIINSERNQGIREMYEASLGNKQMEQEVSVYGTKAYMIKLGLFGYALPFPLEVNFTNGRYICMVDNSLQSRLDSIDLVDRANRIQLNSPGGYKDQGAGAI